jgi:peptide/nickel transport system permease protein
MTTRDRWRNALARLSAAAVVVGGVTTLTFMLIHLAPGDPVYLLAGDGGSPSYYAEMRTKYGLDRPLGEQFLRYGRAVLSGDFGYSFMYQAPVARVILQHAPASLLLGGTALVMATFAGFFVGLTCVAARSKFVDAGVRIAASVMYAAPLIWTGQLLMIVISVKLGLLPVGGFTDAREPLTGLALVPDVARHLLLPALTLALPFMAVVARVSRAGILDAMREPFARAALARGLTPARVIVRHAGPVALLPVVALTGHHAAQIVAGAALTEALFGWPGIGSVVLHASLHRDYPLVTATFIVISSFVVLVNLLTDAACSWLDPRIGAA